MAKLVDAPGLGPDASNGVGVRVPPRAPHTKTDIPGLDWLVSTAIGAWIATIFTVAGVANSVNIIDGFNGLSSMCGMPDAAWRMAYVALPGWRCSC